MLRRWAANQGPENYHRQRDRLDLNGTSRLGSCLRWGLLSPAQIVAELPDGAGKFVGELCWRDFYHHVLWHFPHALRRNFRDDLDTLAWRDSEQDLVRWRAGETGYPAVDAAMRQLVTTGWMHNRARMIVASFLTKHLLIHWRHGEQFFMRHLFDGDPATNPGRRQRAASTAPDAQPNDRVFNPVHPAKRVDPDGKYERRWPPDLPRVPDAYGHEPWTMPGAVQRELGWQPGRDYPAPIIGLGEGRERAIQAYASARSKSQGHRSDATSGRTSR
jgi:deoxyribodipyrimidine photo-lyase